MNIDEKIGRALGVGRENYDDQTRIAALVELVKEVHVTYERGIDASADTFDALEGEINDEIAANRDDLRRALSNVSDLIGLLKIAVLNRISVHEEEE